jgi:hypothetical protein
MAVWQYTFFIVPRTEVEKKYHRVPPSLDAQFNDEFVGWEGVSVESIETILKESFGSSHQSSYGPVVFGQEERSCVKLLFNGSVLENVTVRLDLRQEVAYQLRDAIRLCNQLDGIIVTTENKTIRSHEGDLIAAIKDSSAIKFVRDPQGFFDSLGPKK